MPNSHRIDRLSVHVAVFRSTCYGLAATLSLLLMAAPVPADDGTTKPVSRKTQSVSDDKPSFQTQRLRGKVVWLAAALKSEFGISTVPEVAEQSLAILTEDGQLIPVVENLRGRAFRKDKRLREMEVEILARRHQRQPLIQVLRLYQVDGDRLYEIDYWCDVCAIVMYETGPCSCCQDDNRLRRRLVEAPTSAEDTTAPAPEKAP